jgi:Trk K+ transport system NAD-binding subunit
MTVIVLPVSSAPGQTTGRGSWVVAATRRLAGARPARAEQRRVHPDQLEGHVVVYGMTQVGQRAASELLRLGQTVVAVDRPDRADGGGHGLAVVPADLRAEVGMAAVGLSTARALILTADDDMGNLQAALAAARRYPALRVVVRMFRFELGRHIQRELPNILTLSNSRLVAPTFVGAALSHDWRQRVAVRDQELVLEPGAEGELMLPGDDPAPLRLEPAPQANRPLSKPRWTSAAARVLRDLGTDRRLWVVAGLIVLLVAVSTLVFRFGVEGVGWFAALYAAVTEIATTGLDPSIAAGPEAVRAYAVVLLFAAAALLAAVYALFTDALVSERLNRALGGVPRSVRGHVVVCGLGAVGLRVAERVLAAGLPVTAVQLDPDDALLLSARRQGIAAVNGDARFPSSLREAQAQRARAVVLATRDDLTNLEAGLMVRREFPQARIVLRMYDLELAHQAAALMPDAVVLSTAALAAPAFAFAALGPRVHGTLEHEDRIYVVAETAVQTGAVADGKPVSGMEESGRVRLLGVERGGRVQWRPPPDIQIAAADVVVALTAPGGLDDLLALTRDPTNRVERVEPAGAAEPYPSTIELDPPPGGWLDDPE